MAKSNTAATNKADATYADLPMDNTAATNKADATYADLPLLTSLPLLLRILQLRGH